MCRLVFVGSRLRLLSRGKDCSRVAHPGRLSCCLQTSSRVDSSEPWSLTCHVEVSSAVEGHQSASEGRRAVGLGFA